MTVQLFSAGLEKASERPKSASHNEFDHYTIEPPAPLGGTKKAAPLRMNDRFALFGLL
ncbi:hypothetical protein HMPREF3036_00229 [Sutterella sp. KLE1602]|nr:hypothetical protein HMPREF3036_00229 [Sutterella sp. KLE1602]